MTVTLADMINEVQMNLSGYTLQQDRNTYLKTPITTTTSSSAAPLIVSLGSTESVGKGVIEIDSELLWVDSYDRISNTATIAPFGRGYLGTTPATHELDTKVTISPTFPRFSIRRAIDDTVKGISASLYAVKTTTFVYNAAVTTYGFNNLNIKNILNMSWQSIGPSKEWIPIRNWDLDHTANATVFGANAQTVSIGDSIISGRTVKVTYATDGVPFTSDSQDYATQTGFPESTKDIIVLGAAYRLLSYLDPARSGSTSPQADEIDSKRPAGSTNAAVKQLYALYQQRLQQEVASQQTNFPTRVHYSRR